MMDTVERIREQIKNNPIIVYIKGSPEMPRCGFSAKVIEVLQACGKPYAYIDVLADPDIRKVLPTYANWPTFPQLYVKGELVGGCDIVTEMYSQGELQKLLDTVETA